MTQHRTQVYPFADQSLARRLERAEARSNADFVETRAARQPESGAAWIDVAGTYAMFDGIGSPVTQTFGLGLFEAATDLQLQRIEDFFTRRGAEVFHEISPMTDPGLLDLLSGRGYRPIELSSVMYRPIGPLSTPEQASDMRARIVSPEESEQWALTAVQGWSEHQEYAAMILDLMRLTAQRAGAICLLAERGGQPLAAGVMSLHEGVALLAGASTIPEARGQGAQQLLLAERLRHAAEAGCELAMMCTAPGSTSQRNAERNGFRVAYTRVKWGLLNRDPGFSA